MPKTNTQEAHPGLSIAGSRTLAALPVASTAGPLSDRIARVLETTRRSWRLAPQAA
jgi:hypothetical protein